MTRFVIRPHTVRVGEEMVEALDRNGALIAGIYPTETGFKVISKFIEDLAFGDPPGFKTSGDGVAIHPERGVMLACDS